MEIDVYCRHDCVCHISYPSCYTTPTIHTSLFSSHHLDTSLGTHLKLLCLIYLWLVRRAKEPGHPCSALLGQWETVTVSSAARVTRKLSPLTQ